MKNLLIVVLIVSLAVWWAVKNPQTAGEVVSQLEAAAATVVNTVSD
jgi:uncharacterized protein (UPF0333 family)